MTAPVPIFAGDFEQPLPKPFDAAEYHNFANPVDTTRCFGDLSASPSNPYKGTRSGRTTLDRYNSALAYQRGECVKHRGDPNASVGTTDYYLAAYKFMPGYTGLRFLIAQLGWQGLHPPVIGLRLMSDHITLYLSAGVFNGVHCAYQSDADYPLAFHNLPAAYARPPRVPVETNVWHEIIVGSHWAKDTSGWVQAWYRLKGSGKGAASWLSADNMKLANTPTLQQHTDGTVPTFWQDTIGAYRVSNPQPTWVEHELYRFGTLADAMAFADA